MRIVVLVGRLTHGGAEKVASLWIRGFVERGYDVSTIVLGGQEPVSYSIPSQVAVYKLSERYYGYRRILYYIGQIRKVLKNTRSDYLIAVGNPLGLLGLIAGFGLGIKIINTEHNSFERPNFDSFTIKEYLQKFVFNRFYYKVTVLTKADLTCIGRRLNNVVLLPNPLSLKPVEVIPPKDNVILTVARYEAWYQKGLDLIIKSFAKVHENYPHWRLQILGDGDDVYMQVILEIIEKEGVSDFVDLLGFVNNPQPIYQKAAIFVLGSRYEGFGMALLEAMSQGCACIACDYMGRQSEILDSGKCGIICECGNVDSMVSSIYYLLSHVDVRICLGNAAIKRSYDYKLETIIDSWESILKTG